MAKKNKSSNRKFEKIIEKALTAAEEVDCTVDEYHRGLATMYVYLKEQCEIEEVDLEDQDMLSSIDQEDPDEEINPEDEDIMAAIGS